MSDAVRGALPIVASVLAGHVRVPLVWGNFETASTRGGAIMMPDLPLKGVSLARYVYGFVVHEAAHIRFSVMEGMDIARRDPRLFHLVNVLEDPRVEVKMCASFPGARLFLGDLQQALFDDGKLGQYDESLPLVEQILSWIMWRANADLMQYPCMVEVAEKQDVLIRRLLPSATVQAIDQALTKLATARDTWDVVKLSQDILTALGIESQVDLSPPEAESGAGEAGDQVDAEVAADQAAQPPGGAEQADPVGDQAQAPQGGEGEAPGRDMSGAPSGDQAGDGAAQQSADAQGDARAAGGGAGQDGAPPVPTGHEQASATGSTAEGVDGPDGNASGGSAATAAGVVPRSDQVPPGSDFADVANPAHWGRACDKGQMVQDGIPSKVLEAEAEGSAGHGNLKVHMPLARTSTERLDGSEAMAEVRRHTIAIRATFEDAVQDATMDRVMAARSGRRLLRDAGPRLARGSTKVFRRQDEIVKVNAKLAILIDASSSMRGAKLKTALQAAISMDLAMEQIDGVQTSVSVFPARVAIHGRFDRHGVRVLKEFDDDVRDSAGRIATVVAEGSTPMAGAFLHACRLLDAPEIDGRRIVLVISDGQPDSLAECKAVMQAVDQDIEFVGIGIKMDLSKLFKTFVRIESVDDLPRKALELVRGMLLQQQEQLAA